MTPDITLRQLAPIIGAITREKDYWEHRGNTLDCQGLTASAQIAFDKAAVVDQVLGRVIDVATGGEERAA